MGPRPSDQDRIWEASPISIPICQKVGEAIPKLGMKKLGRIGIYPNLSRLIWPKKSGKVRIYLDSPRLCAQKPGRIKIYPDSSRLIPNYLKILKSWMAIPIPIPNCQKVREAIPIPIPDLILSGFYPPRDISPIVASHAGKKNWLQKCFLLKPWTPEKVKSANFSLFAKNEREKKIATGLSFLRFRWRFREFLRFYAFWVIN